MASSGKPLGERQLAIPPEIKIYTPEQDARGTNDQFGSSLLDHSYLPRKTVVRQPASFGKWKIKWRLELLCALRIMGRNFNSTVRVSC